MVDRVLSIVVLTISGTVAALGALSWLGDVHWLLELTSHFRLYYALGGVVMVVVLFMRHHYRMLWVLSSVSMANAVSVYPYISPSKGLLPPTPFPPFVRMVWLNASGNATNFDSLLRLVEREKSDVLVLTGIGAARFQELQRFRQRFAHISEPRDMDPSAVIVLARDAPRSVEEEFAGGTNVPLLAARLCPGQAHCFTLLAIHASRPVPRMDGARDRQLDYMAYASRLRLNRGERVVAVGDLKTTPYSPGFEQLLVRSGLQDSARMVTERPRAGGSSWWYGKTGFGLPIDHILLGPGVTLKDRKFDDDVGSEHIPLVFAIRIYSPTRP